MRLAKKKKKNAVLRILLSVLLSALANAYPKLQG